MAANTAPIFELTSNISGHQFVPADTTTLFTLFTAGSFGSRIDSISVISNSTAAENIALYIYNAAAAIVGGIGNVNIPIGSGFTTVAKVEGLQQCALLGYIFLPASYTIRGNAVATITAAKQVDVVVQGGDY